MQLSSVLALYGGAISLVCYFHMPKFHSFIVWFNARPHTTRIVRDHLQARPGLGKAMLSHLTTTSNLQDLRRILLEEWDAIPQFRIIRLVRSMRRRARLPQGHLGDQHGIDKQGDPRLRIDLQNAKPGVALRAFAHFYLYTPPCSQTHSNNQKITFDISMESFHSSNKYKIYGSRSQMTD